MSALHIVIQGLIKWNTQPSAYVAVETHLLICDISMYFYHTKDIFIQNKTSYHYFLTLISTVLLDIISPIVVLYIYQNILS